MDKSINLILAIFEHPKSARQALRLTRKLRKQARLELRSSAVVIRDNSGRAVIHEAQDLDARAGSVLGGIAGALVGLLGGPAGAVIGAVGGAAVGGFAASRTDMGFQDDFLQEVRDALLPGQSAYIALVEPDSVGHLISALEILGGRVYHEPDRKGITTRLKAK